MITCRVFLLLSVTITTDSLTFYSYSKHWFGLMGVKTNTKVVYEQKTRITFTEILPSYPQIAVEGTSNSCKTWPKQSSQWTNEQPSTHKNIKTQSKRKDNGTNILYAWIFSLSSYSTMLHHYRIRKLARSQTVTYSAALPIRNNSSCLHVTQMAAKNRNGKRKLRKTNHKHTFSVFKMPYILRASKCKRFFLITISILFRSLLCTVQFVYKTFWRWRSL